MLLASPQTLGQFETIAKGSICSGSPLSPPSPSELIYVLQSSLRLNYFPLWNKEARSHQVKEQSEGLVVETVLGVVHQNVTVLRGVQGQAADTTLHQRRGKLDIRTTRPSCVLSSLPNCQLVWIQCQYNIYIYLYQPPSGSII